ncbi:hypothetical protein OAK35_02465 [Crocinitomicaceae bacterium]|nr:hypothetical protein [Crocinitomicaceae bacterium]MDC0257585.1 hypothetical protein [Crocinitomicaceae bacterium]
MSFLLRSLGFILLLLVGENALAQQQSFRARTIPATDTLIRIDSLSIDPTSFVIKCGDTPLERSAYVLLPARSEFKLLEPCDDSLIAEYRVFPLDLSQRLQIYDSTNIYNRNKGDREKFLITTRDIQNDIFGGSSLNKSGSISRGVTFGNNQDLGVNSTLNLELSGQIAPNLKLLASVSDDNLPIQPDGNTNQLQEFDQVFIQVYNDRFKMIAGDFWLYRPKGYFMNYKKRAQGLTINYQWTEDSVGVWTSQFSGALSRGKFQRQIIQGVEGNQGPYRMVGAENEPFIIVLAGTERVYIDGRLLERGQEYDYVVDYNTAEVVFTARNQITKDVRIVIEFQYSDQNYARSLFQTSQSYHGKKLDFWFNAYSEQDARNQSLQQTLTLGQKQYLASIGDTLGDARVSSIDSVGFFENQNMYKIIDTLSNGVLYDSVLVSSVNPDSALYRATFEFVGQGEGNYIFEGFNALGRVYRWVAPDINGNPTGDHQPSRLIVTPKQRQMVSSGIEYRFNKNLKLISEVSYTNNDVNTFSRLNAEDNQSVGGFVKLIGDVPLSKDSIPRWLMRTKVEVEGRERSFVPIENYRAVEFDRDWNTRNRGYQGNQLASSIGTNFIGPGGNINVEGQQFLIGTDYLGLRAATDGKWNQNGFRANWDGSFLSSASTENNRFIRHRADVSKSFKYIRIGYKDDHERNEFQSDFLETQSYEFFDYQFYIGNGDSIKNDYRLFYRERIDCKSDSTRLIQAAKARSVGGEIRFTEWENQQLNIVTSYRQLEVQDPSLINATPENTLLGRIEYRLSAWKNAVSLNTFYESGSGLELKREFLYIQVNDGQGVYTWIDYNGDGVKDLNEFEVAQFVDQASYIRVFTPSNEYVKTFSNEFNQSIQLRPQRIWAKKKGFLKLLTRFSNQARFRIQRKTNYFEGVNAFNPFVTEINDTNLISTNSNIRNTIFFNRTNSIFGADYTFQDTRGKTLLASGFDSRTNKFHEVKVRLNIKRKFTVEMVSGKGTRSTNADYTSGRNFNIKFVTFEPKLIYQPNTIFRVSLEARGSEKRNAAELGGELSTVMEMGSTFKLNQREKGSFQGNVRAVNIRYNGEQNSALGFEMLEGLRPGLNFTWNVGYQRSISRNLQLSIQYQGRKSEDNRTIHSGGMEVRALF